MQPTGPPRPFRGAQYDKAMFTFLPTGLNCDVSPEPSRKRKITSSGYQTTSPSNVRRGESDHRLNFSELHGQRTLNSTPAFNSSESSSFRGYPDQSQYWHENGERQNHNEGGFNEIRSDYTPFSRQLQSPNHKLSSSLYSTLEAGTEKTLNIPPPAIEEFNRYDNCEPNSHVVTHRRPNQAPLVTEDISRCEYHDSNAQMMIHKPLDWQPPVVQGSYQHQKRESDVVIVVPTSSIVPPSTTENSFCHEKRDLKIPMTTHMTSNGPPPLTDANRNENLGLSAHVTGVENSPHLQEFGGNQEPVQPTAVASDLYERASNILAELIKVPQKGLNPRAVDGGLNERDHNAEETYKVDRPSDVSRIGIGIGSVSGIESDKTSGNCTTTSVYNLQTETNNLLNVLRLLSAAPGTGVPDNNDGKIQGNGHDVEMMKSTPDSAIHHLNHHPQTESTLSKKHEDGHYLGLSTENVEKGSVKVDGECKLDDGASALAEKLWDGTLKLSTSVSVSVNAFFKSGGKMQNFSWSDVVEVKGKVRLEAFEKYVQDLPRSRSRGLMVMSLCSKEGSSDSSHKGMKEVAKKYVDQRKVGFAKLSSDVDVYVCPHNDAIITIVTKHGFCKGMTYIEDQNVPLIGCVVWKKNLSSTRSKHAEVPTAEKEQASTDGIEINKREKSPEFLASPQAHQPRLSPISQNGLTSGKVAEIKIDTELNKPVLPIPSIASKTSVDLSDDDDLPEYDFRAAMSKASVSKTSEIEAPKTDSEGLAPNNLEQQSEVKLPSLPAPEQKPIEKGLESLKKRNLFDDDDDDMPEWCPPDFIKREEEAKRAEPSNSTSQSNVSASGFADLTSGVMLPPPPPPPPLIQMQLQGKNHPSSLPVRPNPPPSNTFQSQGKNHNSAPHVLPPPPPLTQMQVQGHNNPSVHLPKPPSISFKPETLPSMQTQLPFQDGKYLAAPRLPPLPVSPHVPRPAANDFMHQSSVAISPQMQFKEKDYASAPRGPPPPVDIPGANNFMHQNPAAQLVQPHSGGKMYSLSPRPPAPLTNKSSSEDLNNEYPALPHGFARNPTFRPCFDPPGTKNAIHPSTWRRKP